MTTLDWLIVAFALMLATLGFGRGFVVGVLSFAGFAIGALIGTRLGPLLLPQGSSSPYAPLFGLFGAILAGAILASGMEGIAFRLRSAMIIPGIRLIDGFLGAALGGALGLGIVWILAAVVAQAPNEAQLRGDIQHSTILRELNSLLPTGPVLNALARLDPLPQVAGPAPAVAPPSAGIARAPGVRAAAASVVRVLGTACGLAVEGSGWIARPGIVVTNAHVVAGEQDTTVEERGHEPQRSASVLAFDPVHDVAVLRVDGLEARPLSLAGEPPSGTAGAILGYPGNGPFDARPGRIGRTQDVLTDDVYGRTVQRLLTPLAGVVRPGNSGGPLVGVDGRVLTTVFAGTVSGGPRGGYGVANSTVAAVLAEGLARARSGLQVSTEACASG